MALLFVSQADRAEPWLAALGEALPQLELRVWPDCGRLDDIRYALVWRPPPGLLASLPALEVIFSLGAGVDALLADPTLPDRPLVRMVETGLTEGMTEWVVLQVLYWHRNLHRYRRQQDEGRWHQLAERLAAERRVTVLGLGELGSAAARALAGLGFRVAGWSRSARQLPGVECRHGQAALPALLAETDILVCLLPLTADTSGLLNAATLAMLPAGAIVINAARGGHVVEADLAAALDRGHLAGASLDVFQTEPLPAGSPLWHHPQVVITPHVAAVTHARTAAASVITQLRRHLAGLPLQHLVDRRRGY